MKIYRDNIEIELKASEVENAYRHQLYEMDKTLLKSRLMDFIFTDEFERIKDKELFYDEATAEFRRCMSNCEVELNEALEDAITCTLFKHIEPEKVIFESEAWNLQKGISYEINIPDGDSAWSIFVVQIAERIEITIGKTDSNVRRWVSTTSTDIISGKEELLSYIKDNLSEWTDLWTDFNNCI